MNWRERCAVVIPCFNERACIAALVREVRVFAPTVFVVDDGSTDGTADVAREAGATIIAQAKRCGKGAALMRGLVTARSQGFAYALCLDGDGQHSPMDIPAFFNCSERTNSSLVIGNRLSSAVAMPWVRRCVNKLMSQALSWAAGERLLDTQCGFRLLRLSVLSQVQMKTEHFEFESELLIEVLRAGGRVEFIPVQTIYQSEQSKINPLRDTVRWLLWFAHSIGAIESLRRKRKVGHLKAVGGALRQN